MTKAEKERERKRQAEQEKLLRQLQLLIFNVYLQGLTMAGVKRAIAQGNDRFYFSQNATANASMNRELSRMAKQMDALLINGIERSWKQGEENFWDKMQLLFSKDARRRKAIDQLRVHATEAHRKNAAQAFHIEKRNGLNISDRVWNLAGNAKKEMEVIIQNGIKEGKSAEEIQQSIRGYLKEPDKLFRRVRNKETGELEWSDAAKRYKPGQGVYRSAYKNAMRLARTEINAAYRQAQWEQYQNDPTVVGIRIELSNNHTTLVNGVPVPFYDICDELRGDYPKTFRWTNWHPQCRCIMTPILMSDAEYRKLVKAENEGKQYTPKQITKMPKAFDEWIEENMGRIDRANNRGTLPLWLKKNIGFTNIKINHINDAHQVEIRKEAWQRYNSHSSLYEKAYFDKFSGGYNVYHKAHQFAEKGGGGEAEKTVGKILAKYNGKQVEFLPEGFGKSADIGFDGQSWDIKFINDANEATIRTYIKDARKAENAIFYFTTNKNKALINAVNREVGNFRKNNRLDELPDIYFIDKNGILQLLWSKEKGAD